MLTPTEKECLARLKRTQARLLEKKEAGEFYDIEGLEETESSIFFLEELHAKEFIEEVPWNILSQIVNGGPPERDHLNSVILNRGLTYHDYLNFSCTCKRYRKLLIGDGNCIILQRRAELEWSRIVALGATFPLYFPVISLTNIVGSVFDPKNCSQITWLNITHALRTDDECSIMRDFEKNTVRFKLLGVDSDGWYIEVRKEVLFVGLVLGESRYGIRHSLNGLSTGGSLNDALLMGQGTMDYQESINNLFVHEEGFFFYGDLCFGTISTLNWKISGSFSDKKGKVEPRDKFTIVNSFTGASVQLTIPNFKEGYTRVSLSCALEMDKKIDVATGRTISQCRNVIEEKWPQCSYLISYTEAVCSHCIKHCGHALYEMLIYNCGMKMLFWKCACPCTAVVPKDGTEEPGAKKIKL